MWKFQINVNLWDWLFVLLYKIFFSHYVSFFGNDGGSLLINQLTCTKNGF